MTEQAEAESSPKNYRAASELFDKAREACFDEKTIMLTSGHSRLCRALEAGIMFTETTDAVSYSDAMRHLQGATEHYLKGDFQNFAEYARAIGLLLEANMYMVNARRENGPAMKSKLYAMAEKVLQASANAFNAAEHPEKRDRSLQLLRSVKEDKELALSLEEILKGLSITSTTSALVTPTSTREKAVGIERFDHADIQTHLTVSQEVTVGEQLSLQLDLVNVGSDTALLMRLTDLFPKAFRVVEQPNQYVVENGVVELNGKRFEPLRVECVKMNLQAMDVGDYDLAPQVTYVDDLGTFRTQKTNPVTVSIQPGLTFKFRTESAQNIFDYLTGSFVEDYMRRRMTLEKSGFRTLTEIIKEGRTSKSSVYGRNGHPGRALSELETRGLVESRIFTGERGRGGKILRVRVAYEKDIVRRQVDQKIMKKVEK